MTHVATFRDVSEMDLPRHWGRRFGLGENDAPILSSSNPYMLVRAQGEHVGRFAHIEEASSPATTAVASSELTTVTILEVLPPDAPSVPAFVRGKVRDDLLIRVAEWLPGQDYHQLRAFWGRAGHSFVLRSSGHPDIHLELDDARFATGDGQFQAFGASVVAQDRPKVAPNVPYTLEPVNTSTTYRWTVNPGVTVRLNK